jgi:pimeloyl-ACP methyl ester carboxylesterase
VKFSAENHPMLRSLTLIAPVGLPSMTAGPSHSLVLLLKVLKCVSSVFYSGYLHEWFTAQVLKGAQQALHREWTRVNTPRFEWYKQHMLARFESEKLTLPRSISSTIMNLPFNSLSSSYTSIGAGNIGKSRNNLNNSSSEPSLFPVLALWGTCDKTVPCDIEGLKRLIPHACVKTWSSAGHMLPVELAEEVGEEMLRFWQIECACVMRCDMALVIKYGS